MEEQFEKQTRRKIEKLIRKTIFDWVGYNFGTQEAEDPSWDIDELSRELSRDSILHQIYREIDRTYHVMDCIDVAKENGIELTKEQIDFAVDEFIDSEAYVDRHTEDWLYFINKAKGE